jgi:hypothetical protein
MLLYTLLALYYLIYIINYALYYLIYIINYALFI